MSPFSGDPRLHEEFSRIREDALARRANIRRKLGPLPAQPGVRSRTASFLRSAADRLAPQSTSAAPEYLGSTRRNSVTR
jgi:hypothetical protein